MIFPCVVNQRLVEYKPVTGQSEVHALVRNHKYIHHSGLALVLYVLVVIHSCIIYSILPCLGASSYNML